MIIAFSKTKGKIEPLDFHSHNYYEIYIFHGGDCRYIIDNQVIELVPGTILLMNGKSVHKAQVIKNESEYERSALHFMPEIMERITESFGLATLFSPFTKGSFEIRHITKRENLDKIADIIEDLNQLSMSQETEELKVEIELGIAKILLMIDRVSEPLFPSSGVKNGIKEFYTEQIVDFIQKNYAKPITIEQIGQELNLSASYMSRLFKEITGYTIVDYLMYYRFTQAKYLIEISSDKTFKEIAASCGFQSSAHFCRFIKKKTGMTPSIFKQMVQGQSYISPQSK